MSNPTTPFNWQMPTNTDLVTDLPADFEVFGQAVATSMADLLGGTTGQILSKNSNTDMDFVWIANDQGDITGVTATSPLTGGGTSGAITVGIQASSTTQSGAVQLTDSTSSTSTTTAATPNSVKTSYDLAAAAIPKSTVTTNGDVIYATGSSAVTRLGIGSTGQVLTVSGGIPAWATPSSGGGLTLLSTTTLSGASTTISSISQSYTQLQVLIISPTTTTNAYLSVAPNGASNVDGSQIEAIGTGIQGQSYNNGDMQFNYNTAFLSTGNQKTAYFTIYNYTSTTQLKPFAGSYTYQAGGDSSMRSGFCGGMVDTTSAISSLQVKTSGGTFTGGTVLVYGVK